MFSADPTKNSIFVLALKAGGMYNTITAKGWKGTVFAPTDAVSS